MANILYLRLEGPLQSWGERGRWSVRDTATEPTKSGVVGLLGAALGLDGDEPLRELAEALRMGVRVDQPGTLLVDYHTIGGGYASPMLLTAEGKPKKNSSGEPHTEISQRAYLCDASFLVALHGPERMIDRLAAAVQAPHWPPFLGRKSCPLSSPPFAGVGAFEHGAVERDLEAALRGGPWPEGLVASLRERKVSAVRGVIESVSGPGAVLRRDVLLARRSRRFGPRYTREVAIPLPKEVTP